MGVMIACSWQGRLLELLALSAQYASQSDPARFVTVGALQCASGC